MVIAANAVMGAPQMVPSSSARFGTGELWPAHGAAALAKRMAEDLCDYLAGHHVKVQYLHSEIHSIERIELIQDLRMGTYDVLVGVAGKDWIYRKCLWWLFSMRIRRVFCARIAP